MISIFYHSIFERCVIISTIHSNFKGHFYKDASMILSSTPIIAGHLSLIPLYHLLLAKSITTSIFCLDLPSFWARKVIKTDWTESRNITVGFGLVKWIYMSCFARHLKRVSFSDRYSRTAIGDIGLMKKASARDIWREVAILLSGKGTKPPCYFSRTKAIFIGKILTSIERGLGLTIRNLPISLLSKLN